MATVSTASTSRAYQPRLQPQSTNQPLLAKPRPQHQSSHSLSRSFSQTHSRGPKSRSISSLPLPPRSLNRLASTSTTLGTTASASPISPTVSTAAASGTPSRPALGRSSSVLSRGLVLTPSRLPSTDTVSYFPPFESMGSVDAENKENQNQAAESSTTGRGRRHGKGRSLGSLGALVSWGLSFGPSTDQPTQPPTSMSTSTSTDPAGDCKVVEALVRRVSPSGRRVLEPFVLSNRLDSANVTRQVLRGASAAASEAALDAYQHKRGVKSEDEVERLIQSQSCAELLDAEDEDVGVVDRLIDAPTRRRTATRPALHLTLPSLPSWRFPLPSPPVTSLSPDIPLEAFLKIDNPATQSPVRPTSYHPPASRDELDDIDDELTVSSPTFSQPFGTVTPSHVRKSSNASSHRSPLRGRYMKADLLAAAKAQESLHDSDTTFDLKPHLLERSISRLSSDSKETVRPAKASWDDGEATPRPLSRQRAAPVPSM